MGGVDSRRSEKGDKALWAFTSRETETAGGLGVRSEEVWLDGFSLAAMLRRVSRDQIVGAGE